MRKWYQDEHVGGYIDGTGHLDVCEEYDVSDADSGRYSVEVQNHDGYYDASGKFSGRMLCTVFIHPADWNRGNFMGKRISALLLAMVIVIGSVLNGITLKVKAASVAVSEEFAVELTMMLYNLLETVAISSGIKDGLDDYESGSSLYDAFIASMESMADPPFYDSYITQPDGSRVTIKEALDAVDSTLGNNALKLPTSETFAKYRVISGSGGNEPDPTPTPSSDPDSTPVPDTGYQDPFSYIQDVLVAGTLVTAMAGFFNDLYNGKIEGIDANNYTDLGFTGKLDQDADGNYLINGYILHGNYYHGNYLKYLFNDKYYYPVAGFYGPGNGVDGYDTVGFLYYNKNYSQKFRAYYTTHTYYSYKNGVYDSKGTVQGSYISENLTDRRLYYSFNIPIFDSQENAKNYFLYGSITGLLNGEAYDFPDLATSTAERLQPLTGYEFAPGRLPGINAALSTAAAALPEPGLDPAENTEAYKDALNAALTAALPEPAPEPEPDPDPSPSPDPGADGEGEAYKRDLRLLFPFCIPFDFIHLLQALCAEPETPRFEIPVKLDFIDVDTSFVIDLSWMDPIMKIWRLGELGLFIVMLMMGTRKVIKW